MRQAGDRITRPGTPEAKAPVNQRQRKVLKRAVKPLKARPVPQPATPHGYGKQSRTGAHPQQAPKPPKRAGAVPLDTPHGGFQHGRVKAPKGYTFTNGKSSAGFVAPHVTAGPGFGPDRVAALHDIGRLTHTALDTSQTASHRIAAARELRVRHNVPVSDTEFRKEIQAAKPAPKPHHSFLHGVLHAVTHAAGDVGTALTMRQNDNLPPRTFFKQSTADKFDKAVQKGLAALNDVPKALVTLPNPNMPGATPGQKLAASTDKSVAKAFRKEQRTTQKFSNPTAASIGPGGKVNPTTKKLLKNAAGDVVSLPANAIQSTYLTVAHPEEVAKGTFEQLKHPVKSFEQHPVNTLLIARGLEGALSRGAGDVARSGALGKAAKKFANTKRVPLKLVGNATVQRRYSKGLAEQAVQKAVDKRAVKKGRATTIKKPIFDDRGNEIGRLHQPAIQATEQQMTKSGLGRPQSGHLNRRLDQEIGTNNGMTGIRRSKVHQVMHEAQPSLKDAGKLKRAASLPNHVDDAVALVGEGVLKEGDLKQTGRLQRVLERERRQIKANSHGLDAADAALAKKNVEHIDALLGDKEFLANPKVIFDTALGVGRGQRAYDAGRSKYGDFGENGADAAARRVVLPFAERGMGLKYNETAKRFERQVPNRIVPVDKAEVGELREQIRSIEAGETKKRELVEPGRAGLKGPFAIEHDGTEYIVRDIGTKRALSYKYKAGAENALARLKADLKKNGPREATKPRYETRVTRTADFTTGLHDPKLERLKQRLALAEKPTQTREGVEPVSTEEIVREFKKRGGNPEHLFYVGRYKDLEKPSRIRGGSGGQLSRGGASKRYTGADTHTRAYHRSYAAITEHMAHSAARIERHEGMNDLTNLFGLKHSNGEYFDNAGADAEIRHQAQLAKDTNGREGGEYVKMTVARQSAPASLMSEMHPAEMEQNFHDSQPGDSHIVLFPKAVAERINKHENLRNTVVPEFQTALHYFRHAVLPTSPRWLAGNVLEALLRTAINDPTLVRSMKTGHKLGNELAAFGPKGVRQLERLQAGAAAGHFGSQKYLDYFRPEDARNFMGKVHAFRQTPGAKQVGDAWDAYYKTVVGLNERLESSVYYGALGKEARAEVQAMTGDWHKTILLGKAAYQDVARGLLDSNNVARYVATVDKMRGRYANLSPKGRWWTTTLTPFAPWMVNALHFVAVTMPAHHPVLTGLLAAENLGTEKRRKGLGLPPWLEGAIPIGGKAIDVNRFTPAGVLSHGPGQTPVLSSLRDYVLPQASSFLLNLAGKDWTLKDLPAGASPMLVALNTAFETFIPFLSAARRVREGGGTSIPGSTLLKPEVKPGTRQKDALRVAGKVFLPGFPENTSSSGGVGDVKNLKPSKPQKQGGNRFLQGGGNRFLQPAGSGNRFLRGG